MSREYSNGIRPRGPAPSGDAADFPEYREEAATSRTSPTSIDSEGEGLQGGDRAYTIRFPPNSVPPVRAFWSVTVYDSTAYLIPNPIGRHHIGDRTAGLRRDPDGGVTIHLQTKAPAAQNGANWLPVPQGPFSLDLRLYRPDPLKIDTYTPPPVKLIN